MPQSFLFLNKKCRRLFTNRQKAGKIAWTVIYRRAHRKVNPCMQLADQGQ